MWTWGNHMTPAREYVITTTWIQSRTYTKAWRHGGVGAHGFLSLAQLTLFHDGQTFLWANTLISFQSHFTTGRVQSRCLHTPLKPLLVHTNFDLLLYAVFFPPFLVCFKEARERFIFSLFLVRWDTICNSGPTHPWLLFHCGGFDRAKCCNISCTVCECSCLYWVSPVSHQNDKFIIPLQNNTVMGSMDAEPLGGPWNYARGPCNWIARWCNSYPPKQSSNYLPALPPHIWERARVCVCVCDEEGVKKSPAVCLLSPGGSCIPQPCVWLVVFIFLIQVPT